MADTKEKGLFNYQTYENQTMQNRQTLLHWKKIKLTDYFIFW